MREAELLDEKNILLEHQKDCDALIDLIQDGAIDLDQSTDMATVTASILGVLSETISKRIINLDHLIEAESNKSMDRFIRRGMR